MAKLFFFIFRGRTYVMSQTLKAFVIFCTITNKWNVMFCESGISNMCTMTEINQTTLFAIFRKIRKHIAAWENKMGFSLPKKNDRVVQTQQVWQPNPIKGCTFKAQDEQGSYFYCFSSNVAKKKSVPHLLCCLYSRLLYFYIYIFFWLFFGLFRL